MRYVLVGAVKGQTRDCFGFKFVKGECEIPGDVAEKVDHVLRHHYSAFPEHLEEKAQAAFDEAHPNWKKDAPADTAGNTFTVGDELGDDGSVKSESDDKGQAGKSRRK